MTTQHTPGPWHIEYDEIYGFICDESGDHVIAQVEVETTRGKANIALMTAAPDLLLAAQVGDAFAQRVLQSTVLLKYYTPMLLEDARALQRIVAAAVAKATGAQP